MLDISLIKDLRQFLQEARQKGYASGATGKKMKDGCCRFRHKKGKFVYVDTYAGSNPFMGQEVILYEGKRIWMIQYYGGVSDNYILGDWPLLSGRSFIKQVYAFLRKALLVGTVLTKKGESDFSSGMRGPNYFNANGFVYVDRTVPNSNLAVFRGAERIRVASSGKLVYELVYHGGLLAD